MTFQKSILRLLFVTFALSSGALFGDPTNHCPTKQVFQISVTTQTIDLSSFLAFLETEKEFPVPDDLSKTEPKLNFIQNEFNPPNLGNTRKTVWLCLNFHNSDLKKVKTILNIRYPLLDTIEFFFTKNGSSWDVSHQGRKLSFQTREIRNRFFYKSIELEPNESAVLFIKAKSASAFSFPLFALQEEGLNSFLLSDSLYQGFYFGVVTLMALYSFFFYFLIKDKSYLAYALYLLFGSILFQMSMNGHFSLIFPNSPDFVWILHNLLFFLFIINGFYICIVLFELKTKSVLLYKIFVFWLSVSILSLFLLLFLPYRIMNLLGDFLSFTLAILASISAFIVAFVRNYRPARYFFVAFLFVVLGGLVTLFRFHGILPVNPFTDNALQTSMALEVIFMSFGLGERINLLRDEKELLQIKVETDKQKLIGFQKELELAQKLQASTLPEKIPQIQNLKIGARYLPASLIGGDFYDLTRIDYHRLSCLIADVTGHGIPAAIEAAMLKIAYSQNTYFAELPSVVLERINKSLAGTYKNQLLTASALFIDSQERTVTVANAGHPALYWLKFETNEVMCIRPKGKLIGFSKDWKYEEETIVIEKKDKIFIFTDGLWDFWENLGKQSDGEENLLNWLRERIYLSHESLMNEINAVIDSHTLLFQPEDDVTFLLFSFIDA